MAATAATATVTTATAALATAALATVTTATVTPAAVTGGREIGAMGEMVTSSSRHRSISTRRIEASPHQIDCFDTRQHCRGQTLDRVRHQTATRRRLTDPTP